ncbi:MAG: OsmC family protein [Chloroflexota bacterium]|nr:OsmC family protein [Chloroflexota bacterium]
MSQQQQATVEYQGGMVFRARSGSGHEVLMDAMPDVGGQERGARPTEMLLVGLGGCTGMDVISILRKMHQDVTGYRVEVSGTKADEHPRVFTEVTVHHVVTGRNVSADAVERAVKLSWEKYCSVSAMLSKTAQVTHSWTVLAA